MAKPKKKSTKPKGGKAKTADPFSFPFGALAPRRTGGKGRKPKGGGS